MPTAAGPNTFGEENLVFGYDTGDTVNSYIGAPVQNYIHNQNAVFRDNYIAYQGPGSNPIWIANHPYAIRAYNAAGGDITGYVNTGVGDWERTHHAHWQHDIVLGKPVVVMNDFDGQWKAKSFGTGMGSWASYGKTHGDSYTISWLQWVTHLSKNAKAGLYTRNTSGSHGFHDGQANSPSAYNTKLRTWQRVYQTYTTSSVRNIDDTYASIYMYGHYDVRATVKIADVQFNWGSYPAQFYDGAERTVTEGLIDLTGNSTINLTNVSFDSNAQMTFDGTSDHITGTLPILGNGAPHTIEIVMAPSINQSSFGSRKDPFTIGNAATHQYSSLDVNPGYMNWYFYSRDTTFTNAPLMTAGNYYHMILSYSGGASNNTNKRVWFNGVEQTLSAGSSETSQLPDNPQFSIGRDRGRNTAYFPGDIPIFKVYNRALTEQEVRKNYKAIKGRFNI